MLPPPLPSFIDEDDEPIPPTRRSHELVAYQAALAEALDEVDALISWSPSDGWSHADLASAFAVDDAIDVDDEWEEDVPLSSEPPTIRSPSTVRYDANEVERARVRESCVVPAAGRAHGAPAPAASSATCVIEAAAVAALRPRSRVA